MLRAMSRELRGLLVIGLVAIGLFALLFSTVEMASVAWCVTSGSDPGRCLSLRLGQIVIAGASFVAA
jgi:hypothetical protein